MTGSLLSATVGFLRFLVVVQLLAAAAGLAVVDEDEQGQPAAVEAPTTTSQPTTAARPVTTARPTSTVRPTTTTTTRPAPVLKPAANGHYDYRETITGPGGTQESTDSYALTTARETEGELRQSMLDVDVEATTVTTYAWRTTGLFLMSTREDDGRCDFEPDILLVPSPLTVGRQWTVDSSCTTDQNVHLKATSHVVRTDRVTVAGRRIDVHVIETKGEDFRSLQFFALAHGLVVREETTYQDGTSEVIELLNVDPKKTQDG